MIKQNKLKIINDPIYGFITIPSKLIFDIIEHPYFQRLRRINQMGLSHLVYPGAQHTRFQHAVGCIFLMQKAIHTLRIKGIEITPEEEKSTLIAILLHDIGHGPFSHALENSLVKSISHEKLSLEFMKKMNNDFSGKLQLAIQIFTNQYHKVFLHQLISSQLDVDRLDYLKRDSFYTGVAEGNINSERLISMLNVKNNHLVVEQKGVYSVEKFLLARRLMYWQVYLHKTSLGAELMLIQILKRAKEIIAIDKNLTTNEVMRFFLNLKEIDIQSISFILENFAKLDDYDILMAIKKWQYHDDTILSKLCQKLLNRKLLKVKLKKEPFRAKKIQKMKDLISKNYKISEKEVDFFLYNGKTSNQAYNYNNQQIMILHKNGNLKEISDISDQLHLKTLAKPVVKNYLCYPKNLEKIPPNFQ